MWTRRSQPRSARSVRSRAASRKERVELLESVIATYKKHYDEMAAAISDEMGAPLGFAKEAQAAAGLGHLAQVLEVLRTFEFDEIDQQHSDHPRADRGLRFHHPVELAHEPDRLQGRSGARHRLHHGAEAKRSGADVGRAVQPDHARSGRSGRRLQHGQR